MFSQSNDPTSDAKKKGTLSFLLGYARRYVPWAVLAFVAISIYALASGASIYLIDPIFSDVLLSSEAPDGPLGMRAPEKYQGEDRRIEGVVGWLNLRQHFDRGYHSLKKRFGITSDTVVYFVPLLVVIVFWLRSLTDFLSGYAFQRIGLGITTDIRNDIFARILSQSTRFHNEHPTGELASRVINDVSMMQVAVSTRVLDFFQQAATVVVLVALLLSTNLKLALIVLIAAPILLYPIMRFGRGMRQTSHSSQERMADLSQLLIEAARGHRVVRAFGMEEFEVRKFAAATRSHLKVRLRASVFANLSGPVVGAIASVGVAAFLIYTGRAIRAYELTAAVVLQFLLNLVLLYDPVRRLNKVHLQIQEAIAAAMRVEGLMEIPLDVEESPDAIAVSSFDRRIDFANVGFSYGDFPVLEHVDLEVSRGEVVALVGPSGSGKTTLVSLLLRFFDPTSGRVLIDGIDIRDLTFKSLSSLVSIVTQDTVLFNDTVRNNIAYGREDLPLDKVREAAEAAFAHDFVQEMPNGYDSVIGEGGSMLSGGQRQRLAIARALVSDAPILILDEATSQLDSEAETLVKQALSNLMRDRTTLVIAHRLATITSADRIVVLEAGRITQIGSHQELVDATGAYKRLYDLQFSSATGTRAAG
jgi:subfamily B ATP-binding cassette protein MsbA